MSVGTYIGYEIKTYKQVKDPKAITKEMVSEMMENNDEIEGEILGIPFGIYRRSYGEAFELIAGECNEHWHFVNIEDDYEKAIEKLFGHMKVAFPGL